jgi:uncharacterized membrane protein YvbJ
MFCSNCGKEIMENEAFCSGCGTLVTAEEKLQEDVVEEVPKEEAEVVTPETASEAEPQNEGPASESQEEFVPVQPKQPKKISLKALIIIGVAVVLAAVIAIVTISIVNRAKYGDKIKELKSTMYNSASESEEFIILYAQVWRDTIYEDSNTETYEYTHDSYGSFHDDFNDALQEVREDKSYVTSLISVQQMGIRNTMSDLKNPPKKYEDAYDCMTRMYNAYISLSNLAIDSSGESYNTYTEKKSEYVDAFIEAYEQFDLYID